MTYPKVRIIEEEDTSVVDIKKDQLMNIGNFRLDVRTWGNELNRNAFFLPSVINLCAVTKWIIVQDELGMACLVPLKKEG